MESNRLAVENLAIEKKELMETITLLRNANKKLYSDNMSLKRKNDYLKSKIDLLKLKSCTDTYTGLYNKEAIKSQIERSAYLSTDNILIILDVDDFKCINDCFGHDKGDEALKKISNILKGSLRGSDIAGRFGGDEFIVFLRDVSIDNSLRLLERIQENVARLTLVGKDITISIGVSKYDNSLSYDGNFKRADIALYESKNTGKNKITIYSDKILKKGN